MECVLRGEGKGFQDGISSDITDESCKKFLSTQREGENIRHSSKYALL